MCFLSLNSLVLLTHSTAKQTLEFPTQYSMLDIKKTPYSTHWPSFLYFFPLYENFSTSLLGFTSLIFSHCLTCTVNVLCPPLTPLSPLCLVPQCDKEIEQVQSQLEDYKDPPLSLSRLSLKQQKFKTFRETANVSVRRIALFFGSNSKILAEL